MKKLTRRDLLTIFLGAPFAMAVCRSGTSRKFPEGEIVGADASLGHVLRENRNFEVPVDKWKQAKIAVVGGGVAGLSAAWKLKRNGFDDFVLLELEKEVGGTARSGKGEPVGYPWGAHYLPVPFQENERLISLLEEMSLVEGRAPSGELIIKEEFLCREPEERVFYKGRWYEGLYLHAGESDDDSQQFAAFQKLIDYWVNWRDARGRRAFVVPVAECSSDAEATQLDKISFAEWLQQNKLTSERLIWYCDYACRDDYGLKLEQTSAWAGLFYFCSRVRASGNESQKFITFPEGNGRFVDHLFAQVKENVHLSHAVVSIIPGENDIGVICLAQGELRAFSCEKVIYASPMFTAPFVIRELRENAPFDAAAFEHNSWFVANLVLRERPAQRFVRDFPLAWDNIFYDSPSLGYVNATHQKGIDYGPTVLTYYYPMCHEENGGTKLFNYEWRDLADVCLTDIARAHPDIYDVCERIDIMRWGHAMVSPRPSFIWSGVRERAIQPWRKVHFAHTDLSGIALFEEAFYHGVRAADEIISVKQFMTK
ncbi:MAG: FAD-dependent oxidoreductase [Acidobacteria bacterium]|nr:FAD-dependent oxidoreductase [Acidobacteriota bacterium]